MSETPEPPAATTPAPTTDASPPRRQSRLTQVAAWVGIVAGVVFIVAVIFGTGFMVGKNSDGGHGDRHRDVMMFHRGGPPPFPMGPRRDFERRPGFPFPGGPDQRPQPPGAPTTTAPAQP